MMNLTKFCGSNDLVQFFPLYHMRLYEIFKNGKFQIPKLAFT